MAQLPDVDSLRLLLLVATHGSITGAAAELGISQPSASKRLSTLERRLGLRLVDRTRRGCALTPEGTLVTAWSQRVLDALTALHDGTEALRRERATELAVAASLTVAEHLLPAWLGELRQNAPALHVGLRVTNSAHVCDLVRQGTVDIGFIESPGRPRDLHTRVVSRDRLVLVTPPGHPWTRRRRPITQAELATTALVSREPGSGTREAAETAMAADGWHLAPPLLELGSGNAVRNAVLAGAGPALISDLVVAADLAAGSLAEIAVEKVTFKRTLRAVWRAGSQPTGAAANLLDLIRRRVPPRHPS